MMRRLLVICLTTTGLAGCISTTAPAPGAALLPTEQWKSRIPVEEMAASIALAQHDYGLSEPQRVALAEFANRWRVDSGGIVSVFFPGSGVQAPPVAVQSVAFLQGLGIPDVRMGPGGQGAPGAAISIQYRHAEAVLPICGRQIDDYMATRKNAVDVNFGCAVTANLAAQASDPRDLLGPRQSDPADGARASTILGKFRQGEDTGSAIPAGFGSAVAKAVN